MEFSLAFCRLEASVLWQRVIHCKGLGEFEVLRGLGFRV